MRRYNFKRINLLEHLRSVFFLISLTKSRDCGNSSKDTRLYMEVDTPKFPENNNDKGAQSKVGLAHKDDEFGHPKYRPHQPSLTVIFPFCSVYNLPKKRVSQLKISK
ncbi:uncharacterized protein [Montipora capricornis]|uniref:uncharacterized protein n=1 Tax=Montipora capricornis TaxID=246305 RepID=UPI0035F188C4